MDDITSRDSDDKPLAFTWFNRNTAATGQRGAMAWPELCRWFADDAPTTPTKDDLPLIKLATFTGDHRSNAALEAVNGIEGDYDAGAMQPADAAERLRSAGIEALVYTTPSHRADAPRWRVLCPLSGPMPAVERHDLTARLNGALGGILARESFTPAQAYYVGQVDGGEPVQCYRVAGRPLDTLHGIVSAGPPAGSDGQRIAPGAGERAPSYSLALDALRHRDPADMERNEWLLLSGAFHAATAGLVDDAQALADWTDWQSDYPDNDPAANGRTWDHFNRNGTNGDWRTLASVSRHPLALGWAHFKGAPLPPPPAGARVPQAVTAPAATLFDPAPITDAEWNDTAALTPVCIAANLYFADVGMRASPGGVGKTTLALYEAMLLALGWPVFGCAVYRPGVTCILTSEDQRPMLVQRLRKLCEAARLTPEQIALVKQRVRIQYVEQFKLTCVQGDVVVASDGVRQVIEAFKPLQPSMIWIDPAVSFGVGESRVNDAEQGLITAARMIRNAIAGCAVMFIHHTGKANAREKTLDQYSGRGGSALADGARMVQIMQSLTPSEWSAATGEALGDGETGFVLARPKLSYAPPQPHIYVKRAGWSFVTVAGRSVADSSAKAQEVFMVLLKKHIEQGHYVNRTSGSSYAPKIFEDDPDAQGIKKKKFAEAMERLFTDHKITTAVIGTGSKTRTVIFPAN